MSDTIMMSEDALGSTSECINFSQDCAARTPMTKRSSCSICRACDSKNTSLPSAHGGSARSHVRDTVNGRPCRLQHADAPINAIRQLSLMAWRNTILEKKTAQGRVVAIKRGFHPPSSSRGTPMRVFFVPILRFTLIFVLRSHLVRSKIDDT